MCWTETVVTYGHKTVDLIYLVRLVVYFFAFLRFGATGVIELRHWAFKKFKHHVQNKLYNLLHPQQTKPVTYYTNLDDEVYAIDE